MSMKLLTVVLIFNILGEDAKIVQFAFEQVKLMVVKAV